MTEDKKEKPPEPPGKKSAFRRFIRACIKGLSDILNAGADWYLWDAGDELQYRKTLIEMAQGMGVKFEQPAETAPPREAAAAAVVASVPPPSAVAAAVQPIDYDRLANAILMQSRAQAAQATPVMPAMPAIPQVEVEVIKDGGRSQGQGGNQGAEAKLQRV